MRPSKGVDIDRITRLVNQEIVQIGNISSGTYFFKVKRGDNVLNISNLISESGLVKWCQPDFMAQIQKHIVPGDPMYTNQYYLNNTGQFGGTSGIDINAPQAWDVTLGCNNIRVAVIDDGLEDHDDLGGRVMQGFTVLNANGFGRPNAVCAGDPNDQDRVGHGMATTGIIAASHNNIGIAGVSPNSGIYPINIFVGGETFGDLATSMNRAWNLNFGNADVISNSWGFNGVNGPPGAIALEG